MWYSKHWINIRTGIIFVISTLTIFNFLPYKIAWYVTPSQPFELNLLITKYGLPNSSSTWQFDSIPQIIHQSAKNDSATWPLSWHECRKSWKIHFPDWKYVLWTDDDIVNLMKDKFPGFMPIFQAYPNKIMMFDVVRYFILYEFGGIYADMDYLCLKRFDSLLPSGKVSIAESPWGGEGYQNALMASPPRHPFWLVVISEIIASKDRAPNLITRKTKHVKQSAKFTDKEIFQKTVFEKTGPQIIVRAVKAAPKGMFNPLSSSQFGPRNDSLIYENSSLIPSVISSKGIVYAAHLGTCSWCV